MENKMRIIQEFVPGKQMTVAHLIANPEDKLLEKSGIEKGVGALGIVNLTPQEATVIAGDICTKAADVNLEVIDRETGTLIISGTVSSVEAALVALTEYVTEKLGFEGCAISRT